MKGIGYCRVSTEEQVLEGFSLDTQKKEIELYCLENDIELLDVFVDSGVSAFKNQLKDRPQGKFILNHIFDKDIDCIVCISDDRMFRNLEDSISVNNICQKNNVKLVYTRQSYFNNIDMCSSFIIQNFSAIMNQSYSMQYSVKVKRGLENKIRKGEWNGKSPFGYDLVKSHLQVNKEESDIVKLIFDLYLSKSWGSENICNYLNENEIKPPKNSKYWSKTSILCMLKNEVYTGTTVFNRRAPKGSGRKYNPKNEWIVVPNTHEPIISKEDYDKVQEDMEKKRRNSNVRNVDRSKTSSAPLSGLLFCSSCGNVYTYTHGVSHSGKKLYYYQCGSKRHGKTVCKRRMIPAQLLEKFVLYRIQEVLTSDMYKERFEEQLKIRINALKCKKKDINNIKNNIRKLTTQKEKLLNLILEEDDGLLINTYKEKLNSVLSEISVQNNTLDLYFEIDIKREEEELRKQFELNYDDITYRDFQELDRDQLKILFNKLIEKIVIYEFAVPGEKEVCLNITINMRIPGYAPKYALQFVSDLKSLDKKEKSSQKNFGSKLDGGERGI